MGKEFFIYYRGNRWIGVRPKRWLSRGASQFWVLTKVAKVGMASRPYKGITRTSIWMRAQGAHAPVEVLVKRWEFPSMKQVKRSDRAAVKHLAALESELFRDHMALVEHCSMLQYEDGSPRAPGWITIRTTGAAWQVTVKDPDSCSCFTVVDRTLDAALENASLLLGCEEAPWEHDSFLAKSQANGRKK